MNGLVQNCYLKNVRAIQSKRLSFDIHFCNCESSEQSAIMADVVPADMFNRNGLMVNPDVEIERVNLVEPREKKQDVLFTPREQVILTYSAQGLPIKQIAAKINVSNRTVEKHRANIMKKTGLNNIIEAIVFAQTNNFFKPQIELV